LKHKSNRGHRNLRQTQKEDKIVKEIQVQRRYNSVSKTQELQNKMIQKGTV